MKKPHSRSRRRAVARGVPTANSKPAIAKPPRRGSTRRALFVGADAATLALYRDVLESFGFVVDVAESGVAALVTARERLPDLIVMDRQLRDVAGREAIGWLRSNPALRSKPIIVLITSVDDDIDMTTTGPGGSLPKQASPAAIRRTIRRVLK